MARKSRKNISNSENKQLFSNVAAYIRLSVEDNQHKGCSIENQQIIINDFISNYPEFSLYKTYVDNGFTGRNFERKAFKEMLDDIEAKRINCVIVKDLSRLGRNMIDCGYYIEYYFREHHIRFIAVTDNFDTNKATCSSLILPLKNLCNEAYALEASKKTKKQLHEFMLNGDYIGRVPYGYLKDKENCHKLVINEETATVVRQIFAWALEKKGLTSIARTLNELGILSPGAYLKSKGLIKSERLAGHGKWQSQAISIILQNEIYTGNMVQGKTKKVNHKQVKTNKDEYIRVENTHEAIVSKEVFAQVNAYREKIRNEYKNREISKGSVNIFKGRIFCKHCGKSLNRKSRKFKSGKKYTFYCITNDRIARNTCLGVSIHENDLKEVVCTVLEKQLALTLKGVLPMTDFEKRQQEKIKNVQAEIKGLNNKVDDNQKFIKGLYETFVQELITNDEYLELRDNYQVENTNLQKQIIRKKQEISAIEREIKKFNGLSKDANQLHKNHTLTAELIEKLITRIVISHDKKIMVTFSFSDDIATGCVCNG